jgi:PIN domain nuclease of toxin-antitoxin system
MDTHIFLWYVWDDPKVNEKVISLIESPDNQAYISMASLWEMAIKVSTGKLELTRPFERLLPELIYANGFDVLPISYAHTVAVSAMQFHHRDPFDRLLVAQSLVEDIPILSADAVLDAYNVTRLW